MFKYGLGYLLKCGLSDLLKCGLGVYVFELDAVQKTMKTEKNVNELSGFPGGITLSTIDTPGDTLCFWT